MAFKVFKPGMLTLLQDLGRHGYQHLGVTSGGPMDEVAFRWGNALLDNPDNAPQLEITFGMLSLEATQPTSIAIAGADLGATINGEAVMPWQTYLWQLSYMVIVLLAGIVLNAAGAMGAGDAKFAAAAAPFIVLGDLRLLIMLYMANLLAAFATHRLAKHTALRKLAPDWKSWNVGSDFPMGLSLGATLAIYLSICAVYGI